MKRFCVFFLICLFAFPAALGENDMARYETQLKELLHDEMGMPRDEELTVYKGVVRTGEQSGQTASDPRPRYGQNYVSQSGSGQSWYGWISLDSGRLIVAEVHGHDEWILMKDGLRLNPLDPAWEAMARERLENMRREGLSDVREIINDGEIAMNSVYGVAFRFILEDGGVYTVHIAYAIGDVVEVIYRDALYQARFENALRDQGKNQ